MSENPYSRKRVRRVYRQDELAAVLTLPEHDFGRVYGMKTIEVDQRNWRAGKNAPQDYLHFRDNGGSVLAVAHLDTVVLPKRRKPHFTNTGSGPYVRSGALDDRLGAYVILHLLPQLGVKTDILLTIGEEDGQSTAEFFEPEKDYDHIIEFDRMGTDVVMYQYDDESIRDRVRASGAAVGHGSFSDIAYLEHLGVKAMNWGVGYRGNYHSAQGYAYLGETFSMVARYLRFHAQNYGVRMPHRGGYSYYRGRSYDYFYKCDICGEPEAVDSVTGYCEACGCCQDCYEHQDNCQCYVPSSARRDDPDDRDWRLRSGAYGTTDDDEPDSATDPWPAPRAGSSKTYGWTPKARTTTVTTGSIDWTGRGTGWAGAGVALDGKGRVAAIKAASQPSARLHSESNCVGCDWCAKLTERYGVKQVVHKIPAHVPGTEGRCPRCVADELADSDEAAGLHPGGTGKTGFMKGLVFPAHDPGEYPVSCARCREAWRSEQDRGDEELHPQSRDSFGIVPAHAPGVYPECCVLCGSPASDPDETDAEADAFDAAEAAADRDANAMEMLRSLPMPRLASTDAAAYSDIRASALAFLATLSAATVGAGPRALGSGETGKTVTELNDEFDAALDAVRNEAGS